MNLPFERFISLDIQSIYLFDDFLFFLLHVYSKQTKSSENIDDIYASALY